MDEKNNEYIHNQNEQGEQEFQENAPSSPLPPNDTSSDLDNETKNSDDETDTKESGEIHNISPESDNEVVENQEEPESPIADINVTSPYNSITASMVEITKSQVMRSENDELVREECHEKADFITSTNNVLIESTYEHDEPEISEKKVDEKEENDEKDLDNSCVDLGETNTENKDFQDQIVELNQSLITSAILKDENKNEEDFQEEIKQEEITVNTDLTDSCVDLGVENLEANKSNENNEDYAPNNSMEIIDKKQCENIEEDYEKVEKVEVETVKVEPKRKLEDEVFEKPLGGESLQKKITQYGEEIMGRDFRPSSGQMCTISFEACIKDTDTVVEKNESLSFILGDGDVISGVDLTVSLMCKNEKCDMITDARHAYGLIGKKPDIPANATLCYQIHLIDFKDTTPFDLMKPIERLSLTEAKKLRGNFHFNRQDYHSSGASYKKGLKYFELGNLRDSEEKEDLEKFVELKKALLMNLALSDFKQTDYKKALNSLNEVLEIEESHMKALYIRGKVLMHLGETQDAIKSLSKAHELAKDNAEVKNELIKAQTKHKVQYEKEKRMYQKMMSSPEDTKKDDKQNYTSKNGSSPVLTYGIAGLLMAGAALGVALLAKNNNLL